MTSTGGLTTHEGPRIRQLDTLRAVAVLSVMVGHFSGAHLFYDLFGPWGVRLFFVLSGFLITQILLRERKRLGAGQLAWPRIRAFYVNRALRIVPPFYLLLLLAWLLDVAVVRETLPWHLAYLSNFYFAWRGDFDGAVSHFWSLAVEEQFYIFWPWLIVFSPGRHLGKIVLLTILIAPVFRFVATLTGIPSIVQWMLPLNSLDALGAGALLAMVREPSLGLGAMGRHLQLWSLAIGLPITVILLLADELQRAGLLRSPLAFGVPIVDLSEALWDTSVAACGLWLVGRATTGFTGPLRVALEWSPLVFLGRISYGMYLVHLFVPMLPLMPPPEGGVFMVFRVVLLTAITVAIASISWFILERPIAMLKRRLFDPVSIMDHG